MINYKIILIECHFQHLLNYVLLEKINIFNLIFIVITFQSLISDTSIRIRVQY